MLDRVLSPENRKYLETIGSYGVLIKVALDKGKINEKKFWRLNDKLTEWYRNFPE